MYNTDIINDAILCDVWFKHKNLLTIDLLPESHEVSLYKINHYLTLIVDELETFWAGVSLNRTFKFQSEKDI